MHHWEVGKYGVQTLLKAHSHHFTKEIMLSRVKLSHRHHHCCARSKVHKTLQNWGYCLSTNSPLNMFIKQTNILEKGGKRIWLLLSQTAETKENQSNTKTKWIINSLLPILWSLTLQTWQKNCTHKTLALRTSCELHVNHVGVEPPWLQLALVKQWRKLIHLLSMIKAYITSGKVGCGGLGMASYTLHSLI